MERLNKVWSILLTVVLVASMALFMAPATPASAAVGVMSFSAQPLPSNTGLKLVNGSDITDIAASADGAVLYVANAAAAGQIYKSTDSGMTFTALTAPAAVAFRMIAVATDSPDAIIVSDGANIWVSTNGGSLWTLLPQPAGALAGTHTITSVAVGPARSGTLLGREYACTLANNTTATVAGGTVLFIGGSTAGWESAVPAATLAATPRDYMAVKFSPNFVGDRSLVALGASNVVATGIAVQVLNTASITTVGATGTLIVTTTLAPVVQSTIDFQLAVAPAHVPGTIIKGSVALPTDYDATTASGRRSYVGFAAASQATLPAVPNTTDNDVYRVDDTTSTRLSAFPGAGVYSVSYGGTIDAGTLFMGRESINDVRYTTNPTSASPTWTATKKLLPSGNLQPSAPLGAAAVSNNTVVMASAKFATNNTVYAGTSGVESGFSMSTNGGLTFNQTAIIDNQNAANDVHFHEGISFTPDGKTAFMASRANTGAGATAERWFSLWKSAVPVDSGTWIRVLVVASLDLPATNNGRTGVKLTPDFATTNVVYLFDKSLNGNIYRSSDGGDIFASRLAPGGVAIAGDVEENANVMYVSDGGPPPAAGVNVYKSTTGGWTWESPTAPGVGAIRSLVIGKPGELLVGGLGFIAWSKDGGLTYTKYTGANAAESYRISKHSDFAKNSTVFLGDAVAGNVYRYAIGTDPAPVDLIVAGPALPAAVQVGFGLRGGVLYVPYTTGIARSLYPMEAAGLQRWNFLNIPAAPFPLAGLTLGFTSPANTLYLRGSATPPVMFASHDYLASAKPKIKSPGDGYAVAIDPASGRANLVTVALEAMGTGQGVVSQYEGEVTEKAAGWAAGILSGGIVVTQPTSPTIMIGQTAPGPLSGGWGFIMNANTEYQIRFRAFAELSGEDAISPWSAPITLKVQSGGIIQAPYAGPVLLGPQGGATGVSTTPGFAWAPVTGTTEYEVKLSTKADMSALVAGTPVKVKNPAWQPTAALTAATTYFWSVQATAPTSGAISVGTFTTAAPPPKPAPAPKVTTPAPAPVPKIVVTVPPAPAPPAPQYITPAYIWAIIVIGAILVIAVVVLIVRTRRPV